MFANQASRRSVEAPNPNLPNGGAASTVAGALRNTAFATGQSGNVTGAVPASQVMYLMALKSVASGFFACSFSGTMTPGGAATSTLSIATQVATVPGTAPAAVIAGGASVGNVGTTAAANGSFSLISNAVGGIVPAFAAGGIAAAVVQCSQVDIYVADSLSIPYGMAAYVGQSLAVGIAPPALRVPLGSWVFIELLVSATASTLTPLALSNAFNAQELP